MNQRFFYALTPVVALLLMGDLALAQKQLNGRANADIGLLDGGVVRFTNKTGGRICDFTLELRNEPRTSFQSVEIQNIDEGSESKDQGAAPDPNTEYNGPPAGGGAAPQADFDLDDNGNGRLERDETDDEPPGNRNFATVRVLDRNNSCIAADSDFQIRFKLRARAKDGSQMRITPSGESRVNDDGTIVGPGDDIVSADGPSFVPGSSNGVLAISLAALAIAGLAVLLSIWILYRTIKRPRNEGN